MGTPELAIKFLELLIYPRQPGPLPAGLEWVKDDGAQQSFGAPAAWWCQQHGKPHLHALRMRCSNACAENACSNA